jgi:hypothetical protein
VIQISNEPRQEQTNGDYFVWLPRDVLARLNDLPRAGDTYSPAILCVVEEFGATGR